jgi:hypothetical protein
MGKHAPAAADDCGQTAAQSVLCAPCQNNHGNPAETGCRTLRYANASTSSNA